MRKPSDSSIKPKHNVRDSVFTDMTSRRKYAFRLYRALHPEDATVTEDDVKIVTLRRVFTNGPYNDFAINVRDKVVIMVEAQATKSDNVVVRLFIYLGLYWTRVFAGKIGRKLFGSKRVKLAKPEMYVLYSNNLTNLPKKLSLRKLFFDNDPDAPDLVAKVVSGDPDAETKTIIDEFAYFERVYAEQLANKDLPLEEAIFNTVEICVKEGVLADYLNETRGEVENIMKQSREHDLRTLAQIDEAVEEAVEETKKKMRKANAKRVTEMRKSVAKNLLSLGSLPVADIARATGLSLASVNQLSKAL